MKKIQFDICIANTLILWAGLARKTLTVLGYFESRETLLKTNKFQNKSNQKL